MTSPLPRAAEQLNRAAHDSLAGRTDPEVQAARRAVQGELVANPPAHPARATRLFAKVLDDLVSVPGTGIRVGVDPLLSLIPGAGTAVGAGFGAVILLDAVRLRAPVSVLARMGANILLDWLLGLLPVVGAFFDVTFRSNRRNLKLLNRTIADRDLVRRASLGYWLVALLILTAVLAISMVVPLTILSLVLTGAA